jgi:hypothetical protein
MKMVKVKRKFLLFLILLLAVGWLFFGLPPISKDLTFLPRVEKARADTATYYFNSWSDRDTWNDTDPAEMVDGSTSTFSADNVNNHYVHLNTNQYTSGGSGTISAVEVRAYIKNNWTSSYTNRTAVISMKPYFGGSTAGSAYGPSAQAWATAAWTSYYNITSDANGPGTWSWTDVANLDMRVTTVRPASGQVNVYRVEIRVTYTPPVPDLTWATGSADFEIWRSSSLTWDADSLVCGGTLTDDNGSTINCNYLAVVPSTQYRVQMVLKNAGTGNANMDGILEYVQFINIKGSSYWAGSNPTMGNCGFQDLGSDDTGSTACTLSWVDVNSIYLWESGASSSVNIAGSGSEGYMFLVTTTSSVPSTSSDSYANALIDSVTEDSSKITILGASGSQSVDIVDASGNSVSSPSVDFTTKNFDWGTQTSTGTFGTSSQKVRATNGTTDDTWSVNLAGSATTTTWTANSYHYDFNDDNGSGYTDGADADSYGGQMTVDPSGGTVAGVPDNTSCPITNISKGLSDSFVEGTTNSIDIFYGASSSTVPCKWDFTGASITQKIPAAQPGGSYSISMTLSIQ